MKRLRILFIRWRKHRNRIDRLQRAIDRCWMHPSNRHRASEGQIRRMRKAYRKILKLI